MDRQFFSYYETELRHLRVLAKEFAQMQPNSARNLAFDGDPPDPYVERLLEGVAYLGARTRLKLDIESTRHVYRLLESLYPDLVAPAPAMTLVRLVPNGNVLGMTDGHLIRRGTRMNARLIDGISTRATYTTAQDVRLWPLTISEAEYLQDPAALSAAGLGDTAVTSAAGIRLVIKREGAGTLRELSLDSLDIYFGGAGGGQIFDAVFGAGLEYRAQAKPQAPFRRLTQPELVGIADAEALLPRVRSSFEGYRLLREYFLLQERFYYMRLNGLQQAISESDAGSLTLILPLSRPQPKLSALSAADFTLNVTPIVNLFERECNVVDLDRSRTAHIVHADRTRPRDFEIYRLLRVEDAEQNGPSARLGDLFESAAGTSSAHVFTTDRQPRRAASDELISGQMRTQYHGDDFLISVGASGATADADADTAPRRLDVRALCTNRDLPIIDPSPQLSFESSAPVEEIVLLAPLRRPHPSLSVGRSDRSDGGNRGQDDLTWRWIAQLSLNHISLADPMHGVEPLHTLLSLYAAHGGSREPDSAPLSRHIKSIVGISSATRTERIALGGPPAFAQGTEITLDVDSSMLSGGSALLLSAILSQLFARHAAINAFALTKTYLRQEEQEVTWPLTIGKRHLI